MAFSANLVHARVTIPMKSGIARDAVENNFHYVAPSAISALTTTDVDHIGSDIANFYIGGITGGTLATLARHLGDECKTTTDACSIKFYAVPSGGGPEGAPFAERFFTLGTVGSGTLPEEVSYALSFRANYDTDVEFSGSSRPRSSDRNRIYLGPICTSDAAQDSTTKRVKPSTGLATDPQIAAIQFLSAAASGHGWDWRAVSRRRLKDATVTFVSTDDAFDTQRRRGPAATVRAESAV